MFFISILKYIRGYVLVHLTGYAPERFLNMCGKRNILIWNLKAVEDGYLFYISVDAYKSLKPVLKKTRTRARILEKHGLPFFMFRYRGRKMFVLGVALFIGMLFYTSRFVWNIEVNGNSYLSEETILEFLKEENADFGTKISQIDCTKLEETLRSDYPEVIWTSIKIYGTKLTVDIQESLLAEQSYDIKEEEVCDIVAAKDGMITHMITRHGTPVAKVGDQVKQGDSLVSGEIIINSDFGEVAGYLYERADADIIAQVIYQYQEVISSKYQKKVYEEDVECHYMIQIGDVVIQNPFDSVPEGLCDAVVDNMQLCLGNNFYFPIFFKKITYNTYTLEENEYTEEEAKALAEQHFLQYLTNLEEKGIQIIEKNVMIKKVNQNYLVSGTVTAEESIVSYQPTEMRSIVTIQ